MRRAPAHFISCLLLGIVILLFLFQLGCSKKPARAAGPIGPVPTASSPPDRAPTTEIDTSPAVDGILSTARSQLGKIYRWGGSSPDEGFDCSGFTQWVFGQHGIELPRSTREQILSGTPVAAEHLKPGDLVFYSRTSGSDKPHHVGIYTGGGKFIHSPRTGARIRTNAAFGPYFGVRFLSGRRILQGRTAEQSPSAAAAEADQERDPSQGPRVYTVQKGDYIWKIARKLGVSPRELLKLNNLDPEDVIQIGQRLLIPPGGS